MPVLHARLPSMPALHAPSACQASDRLASECATVNGTTLCFEASRIQYMAETFGLAPVNLTLNNETTTLVPQPCSS